MGADSPIDPAAVADLLEATGFEAEENILTRRQAQVLALRERGHSQEEIAAVLGTSRANISNIESSARRNVARARETVAIAAALEAPVRVRIDPGTDLLEVPDEVYAACDTAGTKVDASSAALLRQIRSVADAAIDGDTVIEPILIGVAADGSVTVRKSADD